MSHSYWLSIVSFIALLVLGGRMRHIVHQEVQYTSSCWSDSQIDPLPHPFLCRQKIKISLASVADLASIEGISHKKAQAIYDFFNAEPEPPIEAVIKVRGIGPKTLEKLLVYFN